MRNPFRAMLLAGISLFGPALASAVTIDWSPVGSPDNATDVTGFGSVGYNYRIGTDDVTNSQYAEFLNTKDPAGANSLGLYNSGMGDTTFGGINFVSANLAGNKYTLISGAQNHPVNYVTWYDAVRFANWLNNGQGNGDTESGAYTLLGGTPTPSNADSIARNAGATVFLPSEDEWYKAAYYNPGTDSYFQDPTSTNTIPTASGPTSSANHANYANAVGNLTDVGAYTATMSPYGAFDMGGDVWQWTEGTFFSNRISRGGSFAASPFSLQSSSRSPASPGSGADFDGFRVASTPEPSARVMAIIAFGILWWWRKRFK